MLSSILSYTAASLNCPAQRDCKPDGSSSPGISPNLWGGKKSYLVIRDIILSVFFVWDIDFSCLFPGNLLFPCRGGRVGAAGPSPAEVTAPSVGGTSCILLFLLCFFFLFLCFNEAALPSACLPSGAERIRVQSHQRTSASAYELFVLPLLSVSWEANLLIVCIMTFGWQPQWGRNQHPDDNNVIISGFNYEGCAGI